MIKEDLLTRVKKGIQNAGQPVELKTFLTLQKDGWYVEPSVYYNEIDTNKKREIDLIAKKKSKDVEQTEYENILIIECKKSAKKPWVFFKQKSIAPFVSDLNVIRYGNCDAGFGYFDMSISKGAHHFCKYPIHTCSLVAYSNDTDSDQNDRESNQIFRAVEQVLSALTFFAERAKRQIDQSDNNWSPRIEVVYPIIVFDGPLLSASITDDDIAIEETSVVHYRMYQEFLTSEPLMIEKDSCGPSANYKSYIIPIIRQDHFEEYIHSWFT